MANKDVKSEPVNSPGKTTPDSLHEICAAPLEGLRDLNPKAYSLLMNLMEEGVLEQHMTSGELNKTADTLLKTLRVGEEPGE